MTGALRGVRGVVLTQAWAGSFCTELLGFLGADIIQVEVRRRLDAWRGSWDTPMPEGLRSVSSARHPWNCNPLYNSVNLMKRCVTLDLEDPDGKALFCRLVQGADFVAENFTPRVMGNLGLDYEQLQKLKPDIILCSLSAYGHEGPWANIPGIGGTIEPTSGMSALLGYRDGPPLNSGQMYPDAAAALNGAAAILVALRHRQTTGRGQFIDLSMQESNLTFVGDAALEYALLGRQRPRMGNRDPDIAPHGVFPCRGDAKWVAIACETEEQWLRLAGAAGRGWEDDSRFASNELRKENEEALEAEIAAWTAALDRGAVAEELLGVGVIAAPVVEADEVTDERTLRQRGTVQTVEHAEAGVWEQVASPFHFSGTASPAIRPAPLLGEHSFEVLHEHLGLSEEEFVELSARGVTGEGPPPGVQIPDPSTHRRE
ncbi:MAG: CaiB/BaiF CoA transferase family protein [Dehalococcoidia bacterium]